MENTYAERKAALERAEKNRPLNAEQIVDQMMRVNLIGFWLLMIALGACCVVAVVVLLRGLWS